jgi:hypothetical protein
MRVQIPPPRPRGGIMVEYCEQGAEVFSDFMKPQQWIGIGAGLGLCFGVVLGAVMHRVGLGIVFGLIFGAGFGTVVYTHKKHRDSN